MIIINRKVNISDKKKILSVLQECDIKKVEQNDIIDLYFSNNYLGCISEHAESFFGKRKPIAYCFIKNPQTKPETLSVVHSSYRGKQIGSSLRNFTIKEYKDQINKKIVYSYTEVWNIACIKSLLNSGYEINDFIRNPDGNNLIEFIFTIK